MCTRGPIKMATFKQDMPPPGGYQGISWARISKKAPSGYRTIFGILGVSAVFMKLYGIERAYKRKNHIEMMDGRFALDPFIEAERHRLILKTLYENREEENVLMKDVPGWVTGTWFGDKLYHNKATRPSNLAPEDLYMHCSNKDFRDRIYERRKH